MKYLKLISLIFFFVYVPHCFALSTDKQQPAILQADSATINHKTGISVYRGHVKLIQGSTVITADILTTHTSPQDQLQLATAVGVPATYSTLPDNTTMVFNASALTINYQVPNQQVDLTGNAKALQGNDSFAGPHIIYDIKQQLVISPPSDQGHTTILIQPNQKVILPNYSK